MKRDPDLVRRILEYVESEQKNGPVKLPEPEGHTEPEEGVHRQDHRPVRAAGGAAPDTLRRAGVQVRSRTDGGAGASRMV